MHRSYLFAREQGKSKGDAKFHAVGHVQQKFDATVLVMSLVGTVRSSQSAFWNAGISWSS